MKSVSYRVGAFVKTGSFYRRCLVLIITITSLLTASIGFCMNYFGSRNIENQLNTSHEILLQRAAKNIDDSLSSLEMQVTQWALNPTFDQTLRDRSFYSDFKAYLDLNKTLMAMQNSMPLIDHTYIYLNNPAVIISDEQGYIELQDPQVIQQYASSLNGPSLSWKENFSEPNDTGAKSVALIDTLPVSGSQRYGEVIVTINSAAMDTMINQTVSDYESTAFMMKSNGDLLTAACSSKDCGLQDAIRTAILQRKDASPSFDLFWKGEKYAVADRNLSRAGTSWTLVTATPLTKLTEPVAMYSKINLGISALGILAAILLSWFASNRIYRPWRELREESSSLRDQLKQSVFALREGFMMQLVQGYYYALSEEELGNRMQNLGWVTAGRKFIILHVQLTGLSQEHGKFAKGDEQLVTFSAGNLMEDLFNEQGIEAKVVNFQDLTLYAWMSVPARAENEQIYAAISKVCETIVEKVHQILSVYVSIVIGRICSTIKQIAETAVESREAMRYRDLHKVNQIVHLDSLFKKRQLSIQYPILLEYEVIQAFRMGDELTASSLVEQFLHELEEKSGEEALVKQGCLKLLGSIHHAIWQADLHLEDSYSIPSLYEQLLQLRETGDLTEWFQQKVVVPIMQAYREKQDSILEATVEHVLSVIHEQYMHDISLDGLADAKGLFSSSLSLAFKKKVGMTYIEYLTQYRVDKAKELLNQTDLKVNEIAFQVGYQPSYFNRIFKRIVGVTPGQYREKLI